MILLLALLFYILVLAFCAWVTLTGRDAWPFSAYPMFSRYRRSTVLSFHCLRFLGDGTAEDLAESESGLADEFDRRFKAMWRSSPPEMRGRQSAHLMRHYWRQAARLRPSLQRTRRLEVIVRTAFLAAPKPIALVEHCLYAVDAGEPEAGE